MSTVITGTELYYSPQTNENTYGKVNFREIHDHRYNEIDWNLIEYKEDNDESKYLTHNTKHVNKHLLVTL